MKEKEKIKKLYQNLESKSLKELLEISQNYEIYENDLFKGAFKRLLVQNLLKIIFTKTPHLKEKILNEFGGDDE